MDQDNGVESSEAKAVVGGAVTLVGHVSVQGMRMVGQIVLTRLLPQEAFGLMAIVYTYRALIELFSDVGIGPSIIQNERGDDPRFLDTAWTIQAVRGAGLFLFATVTAVPVARFYGHGELGALIPAASFAGIFAGVRSTKAYAAERHLRLGWLTIAEVLAQISALTVMVIWSLIHPSVWALVAGGLVGAGVDVSLGHLVLKGYNARFGWEKAAARSLMHFGRWVFLSTLLTFAVNQADRLIFGKMISLADLGIYNIALTIATIPTTAMQSLAGKVIFPLFSRVNQTGESLAEVFRKARRLHLVASGWALSGLIGGGQAAIGLIYEDSYASGGWMLQLLALGAWISTPETTNSAASLAQGFPRWVAASNFAKLVGMCLLLPIGFYWWGFPGALAAYAASETFRYAASSVGVYRRGLSTMRQDIECSAVVVVASAAAHFLVKYLDARGLPAFVQALAVFVVVSAIWARWLLPYVGPALLRFRARKSA
ncbi:MAG TPA: oligosaccharide flippase family protein [Polyangiaceae bacterium]|nr:oligosaccharide flippase family protein [Polyangiaceae bacterium]